MTLGSDAQPVANLIPGQSDASGQDTLSGGQHKPLLQATGSSCYNLGPQKGLIVPTDAPESLIKSSKLLALKQRRLDSLSSSLDLSRESSFDTSAQYLSSQHVQPLDTSDHASSKSPLPLDSTTGVSLDSVTRYMQSFDAVASTVLVVCLKCLCISNASTAQSSLISCCKFGQAIKYYQDSSLTRPSKKLCWYPATIRQNASVPQDES